MAISARLIERLQTFPAFLEHAAARMAPADVTRHQEAGGFSLVEHACHLRDYDAEGCVGRIARMLTEDVPALPDFPGETLARDRRYREQDLASAVAAFARNRARTIVVASGLSSADLARTACLDARGVVTVGELLEIVADHDEEHRREIDALVHSLDVEHLRAMAQTFAEGFNAGDIDRIMHYYGSTYVDVNLRRPVQSHAVRREYFTRLIARGGMRIDVCPDDIAIEGATAIVRGRVEIRAASEGESGLPARELRYLEVARKGLDGVWTAVCGMDGPVQDA